MNDQEDTYASSLAKLNNEEVMLGTKKQVYKQKLITKVQILVDDAWKRYLEAQSARPSMENSQLNEIYGIYLGTIRMRDALKLSKK